MTVLVHGSVMPVKCHTSSTCMLDYISLQLVSLLPESMFIDVIGGLLSHDLPTIQRKAMDLLNTKLQQQRDLEEHEVKYELFDST